MFTKNVLKGFFFSLLILLSSGAFAQPSSKGSLDIVDTSKNRPPTPRIAVNKLDGLTYYWNLHAWFKLSTADGGGGGFVNNYFTDTTAANLTLIYLYPGSIINTSSPVATWKRNPAATKWLMIGSVTSFNIVDNGADPTGTVDAGVLINAAILLGHRNFTIPYGRFLVTTTVNMKDSIRFFGAGRFNSFIKQTSNIAAFKCSYALGGNACVFSDIGFYGSGSGSSQMGIKIDSAQRGSVINCSFSNYGGVGLYLQKIATLGIGYPTNSGKGWNITGCYFSSNLLGLQFDNRAEYCSISNCHFTDNTTAIVNDAGNNSFAGCIVEYNQMGVSMTYISNSGHGNWVGGSINHNNTNLYMLNQSLGFSFVGADIGASGPGPRSNGLIELISCTNIVFQGGFYVGGDTIRTTGCNGIVFDHVNNLAGDAVWINISGSAPTSEYNKVGVVTTQFDKSNNTLADITGLTSSVVKSKTYKFEAVLYTTSNVAGGVKIAIAGTSTATSIVYEATVFQGGLTVATGTQRAAAVATTVGDITAVTTAMIKVTGTITVSASGTLTCQFAQNTTNGTASSVLVGSTFQVKESN